MDNALPTKQTLLQRIKNQHDNKSWDEFVRYYKGYIFSVVKTMNIAHHDAEDIVQSVILKAWESLPEFDYSSEKGRFRGWLARVTKNAVSNFLRKRKWELNNIENPELSCKESEYLRGISLPEIDEISIQEWKIYIANLAWENIKKQLPPETADAFIMLTQGLSPQEVAEKTNIPIDNLYVYKARIKKRVTQEIKFLEEELG